MSSRVEATSPQAAEFKRLLEESGKNQMDAAAWLTRTVGRAIGNHTVSRWANGYTKIPVDVMDAMRSLVDREDAPAPAQHVSALTESGEDVPLFGYANAAGSVLRLNDDARIGVVPIHPSQRGSRSAFAFVVFGDSVAPMLNHGDVGYAIRNRPPRKGQPCLIELRDGETHVKLFNRTDERTLFADQLNPKKELTYALRDVVAIHAVVGVSFG